MLGDCFDRTGVLNAKKQPLRQHESVLCFYRKPTTYNAQGTVACTKRAHTGVRRGQSSQNYGAITATDDGFYTQTTTNWPRSVIDFTSASGTVHPTQKPVPLFEYLVRTYTDVGATVLDSCMGSGTTGVACANTGRKFIGIEKDADYFIKATERIWHAESARAPDTSAGDAVLDFAAGGKLAVGGT